MQIALIGLPQAGKRTLFTMLSGRVVPDSREPGEVLEGELVVACGSGALRLTRLQRPGRGALGGADFLRGFPLPAGTRLPPTAGEGS